MFNLFDPYVLPNFRILDKQALGLFAEGSTLRHEGLLCE